MNEQTAKQAANVVLAAAAISAAYVIVTTPRLRRMAAGLAFAAMTGGVPAWLTRELQQAWGASGSQISNGRYQGQISTGRSGL
jgi:hypothetical protein